MGYMTNGLTFNDLRGANIARLERTEKFKACRTWSRAQWLQALVGELGELANLLKKIDRGDYGTDYMPPGLKKDVEKELADCQIYLDLLAHICGVDLGGATIDKFNEVSKRVGADVWLTEGDFKIRKEL